MYADNEEARRHSAQVNPMSLARAASYITSKRAKDSADWPGKAELN
jgi:hypothetical protein